MRVTAVLARGPNLPDGDVHDHLELDMRLTSQSLIDDLRYEHDPSPWAAMRVRPERGVWRGEMVRLSGDGWALRPVGEDDAPVWQIEGRVFRPGEYVTLRDPSAGEWVFRIVGVDPR